MDAVVAKRSIELYSSHARIPCVHIIQLKRCMQYVVHVYSSLEAHEKIFVSEPTRPS